MERPNTKILEPNKSVSEQIKSLAMRANVAFHLGNEQAAVNHMYDLFKLCYGSNGYKLLTLVDDATQAVGFAFSNIAQFFDFGDKDLNSVAAENAIYCLGRSIITQENTYCAPTTFMLLLNHAELLEDKLFSAFDSIAQKDGNQISMVNPVFMFYKQQAMQIRIPIMDYLLSLFYNEQDKSFLVPTDLCSLQLPQMHDLHKFFTLRNQHKEPNLSFGRTYFYQLFSECQETLHKTKYM